jgi:hypothetical protein
MICGFRTEIQSDNHTKALTESAVIAQNGFMSMDPAKSIIDAIGGFDTAARITGKHISRVRRWTYPASRGGTGGVIQHADALKLLEYAREHGIALGADDFLQAPSVAGESAGSSSSGSSGKER